MAARAKPRITRSKLKCGDLIFFGPKGPSSSVGSIYHAALYLGPGWFIHSTGSSDGVTLASLNTSSYWKAAFAWGRRRAHAVGARRCPLRRPRPPPLAGGAAGAGGFAVAGCRHAVAVARVRRRPSLPRRRSPDGRAVPGRIRRGDMRRPRQRQPRPFGARRATLPAC